MDPKASSFLDDGAIFVVISSIGRCGANRLNFGEYLMKGVGTFRQIPEFMTLKRAGAGHSYRKDGKARIMAWRKGGAAAWAHKLRFLPEPMTKH
jgi:hypothetical protein